MDKKVLVIKIGTALLTRKNGNVSTAVIKKVAAEISLLQKKYHVILVSSGAVGCGKKYLKNYKGTIYEKKAAAAIGNPLLMKTYSSGFNKYGIVVGQVLCERHHFSERKRFIQLKETLAQLWINGVIPIVNENDLVSNLELKFTDNDELATLLAVGFDADRLLICTSAGGFLDDNGNVIPHITKIDKTVLAYVRSDKSSVGLGGMASKLTYAKLATTLGIGVVICGLQGEHPLVAALAGEYGSSFLPKKVHMNARSRWLASSPLTIGQIILDDGAVKAVEHRKSLLSVGVKAVMGKFLAHEVVKLLNMNGDVFAVAKVRISAGMIEQQRSTKDVIVAHADDIVCLDK